MEKIMKTTINLDKHLNEDVFSLENDKLKVKVLKKFGGKVVSIVHKESGYEVLFQPTKEKYEMPKLGNSFEDYDTSGIDEMLPTIDECFYPNSYEKLNDHGDVWAQVWDYEEKEDSLVTSVRSDTLKLDLIRTISLKDEEVIFSYKLKNLTKQDHYYLWAFHGLLNFDDSSYFEFPINSEIVNVKDSSVYDFDYKNLGEYEDNKAYKFYFPDEIKEGKVSLIHKSKNIRIDYQYSTDINKYLGIWINKGGFKGEYNLAIEPTSGYFDSLERAFKNKKASLIKSREEKTWELRMKITRGDD